LLADLGVRLQDLELRNRELAGLEEDAIGDRDLADVMQLARQTQLRAVLLRQPALECEQLAVAAHADHVLAGVSASRNAARRTRLRIASHASL
jgi:hypothetical protein